jgi:uncharacterized protein (TIGR00106 family)
VATADLTIIPLGGEGASVGRYLAEVERRLRGERRVRHRMHATGTSLEGETADILAVAGEMHAVPFEMGLPRVYTILKLDERHDKPDQTLEDKERSVVEALGEGAA